MRQDGVISLARFHIGQRLASIRPVTVHQIFAAVHSKHGPTPCVKRTAGETRRAEYQQEPQQEPHGGGEGRRADWLAGSGLQRSALSLDERLYM